MTSTARPDLSPRPIGRLGPLFAGVWLFFLINPLLEGWDRRDEARGVIGIIATLAFAVVYMSLWVRARGERFHLLVNPRLGPALAYVGSLAGLTVITVACVGGPGLACVVYLSVACVMTFPLRVSAPLTVMWVVVVIALSAVEGWGSQVGTAFGVMAASVALFGVRTVIARNLDLVAAHEVNADLAVEHERTRFARDLHDILGHSLTVITVKAELAQRLMDVDLDRARAEVADLERLSRDALADVRRAVEGYRELTLPGELARARTALDAAEIEASLPNSAEEVPSELRELFAWTVREGITNVIRHSGAQRCEVELTVASAEVRDDGAGCDTLGVGSGLTGLRERASAAGAVLVTRDLAPGFSVKVTRA